MAQSPGQPLQRLQSLKKTMKSGPHQSFKQSKKSASAESEVEDTRVRLPALSAPSVKQLTVSPSPRPSRPCGQAVRPRRPESAHGANTASRGGCTQHAAPQVSACRCRQSLESWAEEAGKDFSLVQATGAAHLGETIRKSGGWENVYTKLKTKVNFRIYNPTKGNKIHGLRFTPSLQEKAFQT